MKKTGGFGSEVDGGNTWAIQSVIEFTDGAFIAFTTGSYLPIDDSLRQGTSVATPDTTYNLYQDRWTDSDFHAIAYVISGGNTLKTFVDGELRHTTELDLDITGKTLEDLYFARITASRDDVFIDEERLSLCARYSSTYTPASAPFTLP